MQDKTFSELTDEELIKEFQENDTEEAFEILVSRYKNPLYNFVYRFLNDYELAGDVVQETMIKVYKNKDSYKEIAKFSTWIYTIAGNLAKTELKRRKRRRTFSIDNPYPSSEDNEKFDLPSEDNTPEEITDGSIKGDIIEEALMQVNEVYREAVILRDVQEMTYEEIAEMFDISVGTVKSRINRGRAQLRELLKDIYKR